VRPAFCLCLLPVTLCGCGGAPQNSADAEAMRASIDLPVVCTRGPDCDAVWSRAAAWVVQHSSYKIQTANDSIIQTMGPTQYNPSPAYTITKTANAAGNYEVRLAGGCDNIFSCIPSIEESRASFKQFVRQEGSGG
jgi:hypothetical protein